MTLIIISLIHEVKHTRSGGYVHTQAPVPITTHTTVVVNQPQIPLQPQYPQQGKNTVVGMKLGRLNGRLIPSSLN